MRILRTTAALVLLALSACAHAPQTTTARPDREVAAASYRVATSMVLPARTADAFRAPWIQYRVECTGDCGGTGGWVEVAHNTVLTGGKTDIVDKYLKGATYTAAWYLLLKGAGTIAAGDTLASHAGWTEVTPYAGNRPAITWGTTSAGSNTATAVSISINATATVAGACVSSVNTGTSGILYSCSDFSASRSVVSGDTLSVTPTISVTWFLDAILRDHIAA